VAELPVNIWTPQKFSKVIESIVVDKDIGYMDAIIDYCAKNGIETDIAAKLLTNSIKQKIRSEAIELNMVRE